MVVDKEFWTHKKVFITGHTGFKGGWLSLWLQSLGAQVTGYALPPDKLSFYMEVQAGSEMRSIYSDICELDELKSALVETEPDIVFHLAAQPLVKDSYRDPVRTYETNVMGTVNLLESIRDVDSVGSILIITSDKCYKNNEWVWGYRESDRLGGKDPYSNSKACTELVVEAYRDSFFDSDQAPGIATARAGNVIGGGDWAKERLVPDIINALMENEVATLRNPDAIRPWQHVLDPLAGYLQLSQNLFNNPSSFSGGWNFGPETGDYSVAHLADKLAEIWAPQVNWKRQRRESPHKEANLLSLDCSKARTALGWQSVWGFNSAVEKTVQWYKNWHLFKNTRQFSLDQIAEFEKDSECK